MFLKTEGISSQLENNQFWMVLHMTEPCESCEAGSLLAYEKKKTGCPKVPTRVQDHEDAEGYRPRLTVMKGSHLVPFCSTCMIIRICIIAYLFSNNTIPLESHFHV